MKHITCITNHIVLYVIVVKSKMYIFLFESNFTFKSNKIECPIFVMKFPYMCNDIWAV